MDLHGNVSLALAASASWGGGDYSGGRGVQAAGGTTSGALRLVIVGHGLSLVAMLLWLGLRPQPWPPTGLLLWGLAGGASQAVSLTAFYVALSRGAMGASAAVSGLIAASIPAIYSTLLEGSPGLLRIAGFLLAAAAIWLIAAGPTPSGTSPAHRRTTMLLAVTGGLGFGFYFITLRLDNPLGVVEPMAIARAASLVCCVLLLVLVSYARSRQKQVLRSAQDDNTPWLSRTALGWAFGVALLDTGGNMLFLAATRLGRLDVAAVLSSLYPAGTILLAAWLLHERPTRRQITGMVVALAAVVMITL
jgi:drug/metabolite transporter (DMT)-like permease